MEINGMDVVKVEIDGLKICTRADKHQQDMNVIGEVIYRDDYLLSKLAKIISSPEVILDVGGHIGTFGLLAKHYWPDSKLIAIEPNNTSCALYLKNMEVNNFNNYHVLNKAISYNAAATCLIQSSDATGGALVRTKADAEKIVSEGIRDRRRRVLEKPGDLTITSSKVQTITVEEIVRDFNIEKIGLAKWDCEGAELDAFRNMSDDVTCLFKCMVGEYHIPSRQGEPLCGSYQDYVNFCDLIEKRFSLLELLTSKTYPLGRFWAFPKNRV